MQDQGAANKSDSEELSNTRTLVAALQTAVTFSETIIEALSILKYLIPWHHTSYSYFKEAMNFLVISKKFDIGGVEEVLLVAFSLISESNEHQECIVTAFESIYISSEPFVTAKNLVNLTFNKSLSDLECLKCILQVNINIHIIINI